MAAPAEHDQQIRKLIEQLVFGEKVGKNQPVYSPGITDKSDDYRGKFETCQKAFNKLMEYKGASIPILAEHLDDKRQSINFRNHYLGNSVGNACYWNIYSQLQDEPDDYSFYGYSRKGRDGKQHVKPYYEGTPFDSEGGMKQWLEKNKGLSYVQKQIKCLNWLLEKEKAIGACDADSYFVNILPLEIRILERRLEAGENTEQTLTRLREIKQKKLVSEVPAHLLPDKNHKETRSEQSPGGDSLKAAPQE